MVGRFAFISRASIRTVEQVPNPPTSLLVAPWPRQRMCSTATLLQGWREPHSVVRSGGSELTPVLW
jgi:hypothetical protein